MRLIRTLLVLAGAGVFLPSPPQDLEATTTGVAPTEVSAVEMLSSATSTFSDLAGFCHRQPGACQTAAYVAAHLEAKAKYSAKLVYEWATDQPAPAGHAIIPVPAQAEEADQLQTGSTTAAHPEGQDGATPSQSTLTLGDLVPAWRGPIPVMKKG
jgi:hypothetical protein